MSMEEVHSEQPAVPDSSEETVDLSIGSAFKGPEESIVGTIFVNKENRIKCIISSLTDLINRSSFDRDLEVEDFARQLKYERITGDIRQVLHDGEIIRKEVEGENGRWYMLELRPHSPEDYGGGVVVTFVDVTDLKETELELAEKIERYKELQRLIIKRDMSERWRVGQFLHDNIGQTLAVANIQLKEMKKKLAAGEDGVEEEIDQIIEILERSSRDARDLSHEVVPIDIEEQGINYAFHNFDRQLKEKHGITCELKFHITSDTLSDIETATHLYHIVHESVRNAADHGGAERVKITLWSDYDYLYLTIEDDGSGFPVSKSGSEGMGINIMRHRMELVDGTLEILDTSDLGRDGVTITCKIPLENA